MKQYAFGLILPLLFGCTLTEDETSSRSAIVVEKNAFATPESQFQAHPSGMHGMTVPQQMASRNVTHYVQNLMQDMIGNLRYVNDRTPIAVATFVFLDEDYNYGSLLGNQLSESFIHELHNFGVPVVDFKTTDFMRVTKTGDFIFSRDFLELSDEHTFNYVLAGTLANHQGGVLVNARIVGVKSKAVVGTAQGFLPQAVVNALRDGIGHDGIRLERASR
ncbi:FlgO family outer membrane protein [Pseudoalteromonas luteoviolacea]|uniref:FlgO domain-containing protein n=1 Tax=Pseudoalteromonas luteoviolacea DSM 6061 TaxID=1365250 RepID=A0A166WJA2_9GAMM|nr:FlgO family outer membrane protein [Pseudoalteromonas luteoviolacea]KZN37548.1 hypothetical protein N475_01680 [Pseudoalteromonas luteoviolacea DSM 6061]MBE0387038.1 hypothetical protein [Pseudoalteromonas luteoviolacea DSM 6061]TQF71883.1 hypothetical protein FLM44_12685 [Pseudoalteromonas luteoviolacea]